MKFFYSYALISCFCLFTNFSYKAKSARFCKENEEIIFSFLLTKNQKILSICKDKTNKYIIYRFGTEGKIEFEYPSQTDNLSWRKFTFYSIHRGGGKSNAGFGDVSLIFINKGISYKIYHTWRDANATNEIGIELKMNDKVLKLKGNLNTQIGALQDLELESDKISNTADN